jgi:hypothetical protein
LVVLVFGQIGLAEAGESQRKIRVLVDGGIQELDSFVEGCARERALQIAASL